MPSVLAIAPGTPAAYRNQKLLDDRYAIELRHGHQQLRDSDKRQAFDLLVLAGMSVDQQQWIASQLQEYHCWRLVPVLYVLAEGGGLAVPGSYRPDLDGLVKGTLASVEVQRRIAAMACDGVASAELVVAGEFTLDPIRCLLHIVDREIPLTEREAGIMTVLLGQSGRTVSADELILHGWSTAADGRHLQILRRHVSNIRRKLDSTAAANAMRTVRGTGYRFDAKALARAS
jgi:DNA-binding winged helix-turn-helix (wHTH) protein